MNRKLLLPILLVCAGFSLQAQRTLLLGQNNYDQQKGIIYSKETTTDFRLHTNGAAFGMNFGKIRTYNRTKLIYVGVGELKHPQEIRQNRNLPFGGSSGFRGYIFGKQNNLLAIRGGIGEKRYFSDKARRKGVALAVSYEGGATLGLLKPYYLVLRFQPEDFSQNNYRSEKYSPENEDRFLAYDKIFGADSFFQGFGEIGIQPGLHGKAALHFDWGVFDEFIKALEAGIMVDFFLKEVPIMAESSLAPNLQNKVVFVNLFLTLQFGKRS